MNKFIVGLSATLFVATSYAADSAKLASETVDSFEKVFGVTEGKRRNHTKGFCFIGTLHPKDPSIQQYSNSPLFTATSHVIGRLSHKGGNNTAADNKPGEYGIGLSITTPDGATQRMAMNTLDFFPVATPQAFAELMRAKSLGGEAVKAFLQKNTDLQRFKKHTAQKQVKLTPLEGMTFNSINSFYLVNEDNKRTPVRWSFKPTQDQAIETEPHANFFYDNIQKNLKNHGVSWNMIITLANASDKVDNAAIPWTGKHQQIIAAELKLKSVSTEKGGQCDEINFDPLVLAPGFEPSADPLLEARRAAYAISFGKRISEKQKKRK